MNIKGQSRKNIIIFLIALILGCTSTPETTLQQNSANTPTPHPTSINTTSVATLRPTLPVQVEDRCLSLEDSLPPDLQLEGVWVRQSGKPYLENLEENLRYRIPLDGGAALHTYNGYWAVSPNGEWLAYLDPILDVSEKITRTKGLTLRVIHSSGYFLSMDYWPIDFQTIQYWVDNENLLLRTDHRNIVLNPFTGKWHEVQKPYWLEEKSDGGSWFNPYQYSPRIDYVIENLEDHSEIKSFVSGESLFGDSAIGFFGTTSWSPDGTMLFLITGEGKNVHILKNDKEILKANLVEIGVLSKSIYDYIDSATWSLDNQRLLLDTDMNSLVLDINENKIYKICFTDKNINKDWIFGNGFFSSKDGKYIIVKRSLVNEKPYVQRIDILIDIENMRAYRLPEIAYKDYIGWLALPETTEK